MFALVKKIFGGQREEIAIEVSDAILGNLKYSDEGWWEANVLLGAKSLGFKIGGKNEPDARLIAHAKDIVNSFADFEKMVAEFLVQESKNDKYLKPFANEIQQLVIEDVMLCWPKRPNNGMIYFRGVDKFRVWRSDYVERKPKGLGFDI